MSHFIALENIIRRIPDSPFACSINRDDFTLENRTFESDKLVSMTNVEIAYGKRIIQKKINWTIQKDEKWPLQGPNGSGKSILLSYIFADNTQANAKNIRLLVEK